MTEGEFETLMKEKTGDPSFTLGTKLPIIPEEPEDNKEKATQSKRKSESVEKSDMWTERYKPR